MVINGGPRSNSAFYAWHLMRADTNERVTIAEIRGFVADDVDGALQEAAALSRGTRCKNFFYAASISPRADELLTPQQWQEATDRLERNLGLTGHARIAVEHEKEGRIHRHVLWSRIDDTMRVVGADFNYAIHSQTSRELEEILGLAPLVTEPRAERGPKDWETFRAADTGIDPRELKAEITALWQEADSGLAFHAALADAGYILARGDRRDFVIVDQAGDDHSLARRISGAKAADIRTRLADVDRDSLPSVAEARDMQRAAADEGSKPAATDTREQPEQDKTPGTFDARQAADFLTEPKAELKPFVAEALTARFGDRYVENLPGTQARAAENIPAEQARDDESTSGNALEPGEVDTRRSHETGERPSQGSLPAQGSHPQRVTPWSFGGLAERLTRYADLFWDFVRDEQSGQPQAEPQPEPASAQTEAPAQDAAAGSWRARILETTKHAWRDLTRGDGHEPGEAVSAPLRPEEPPPDEPQPHRVRPGAQTVEAPEPTTEAPRDERRAPAEGAPPVTDIAALYRQAIFDAEDDETGSAAPFPDEPGEREIDGPDLD